MAFSARYLKLLTQDTYILKFKEDYYEPNYDSFKLDREAFWKITTRSDKKKNLGIYGKDTHAFSLARNEIINNENFYKHLFVKSKVGDLGSSEKGKTEIEK